MSSPSEPVETTSISIDRSFLPSFMIEPLPKLRSIWDSAASSALDLSLSIEIPSTTRSEAAAISSLLMTGIRRSDKRVPLPAQHPESMKNQCTLFVLCSQYVLFGSLVLAYFDPEWPVFKNGSGLFWKILTFESRTRPTPKTPSPIILQSRGSFGCVMDQASEYRK